LVAAQAQNVTSMLIWKVDGVPSRGTHTSSDGSIIEWSYKTLNGQLTFVIEERRPRRAEIARVLPGEVIGVARVDGKWVTY
jgi:hypothetical protein